MRGVGRFELIATFGLVLGCSKGGESLSTFGPPPWQGPDSEGGTDAMTSGPSDADTAMTPRPESTGNATSGPVSTSGDGTTTMPPPGSTGEPPGTTGGGTFGENSDDGGNGMQPGSGWWAHCIPQVIACDAGFSCLSDDAMSDGVCTQQCVPAGNPASCGASPGGTNMPACLTVGGNSLCALDCEGGLSCPGGMVCITENDDLGPVSICV